MKYSDQIKRIHKTEEAEGRSPFSRDRARIIHSAFFRRLQGKTQVLGLGESDFYRTRLTHSIEVAQIASGIVEKLKFNYKKNEEYLSVFPSLELIESIALAHDIGHPPFGHGGEVALNYAMRNDGGFEGNAQTLRICTKLGEFSDGDGLNLTRRTLLGVIKYPIFYKEALDPDLYNAAKAPKNIDSFKPPKCIFDCDSDGFNFIVKKFNKSDKALFSFSKKNFIEEAHKKTINKGFDTSIMELADDIAYGVHDLEDAIALKLVEKKIWDDEVVNEIKKKKLSLTGEIDKITENLFSGSNKKRKNAVSELVRFFVDASVNVSVNNNFKSPLLAFNLSMEGNAKSQLNIMKKFVVNHVIKTPEVQTLEYKGQQMIVELFDAIANNPSRLLPAKYYNQYKNGNQDLRVICDYLAGTTDNYATKLYHKIFSPSIGSIFDKL